MLHLLTIQLESTGLIFAVFHTVDVLFLRAELQKMAGTKKTVLPISIVCQNRSYSLHHPLCLALEPFTAWQVVWIGYQNCYENYIQCNLGLIVGVGWYYAEPNWLMFRLDGYSESMAWTSLQCRSAILRACSKNQSQPCPYVLNAPLVTVGSLFQYSQQELYDSKTSHLKLEILPTPPLCDNFGWVWTSDVGWGSVSWQGIPMPVVHG